MTPQDYLDKILDEKRGEISALYAQCSLDQWRLRAESVSFPSYSFYQALQRSDLALIAELKKASPSKGIINPDFDCITLSDIYQKKGASAFSILTERQYFLGDPAYVARVKSRHALPILRKDFIIDPVQVYESVCIGADAILLILACLDRDQCQALLTLATDLGLDVLLEVHDQDELDQAMTLKGLRIVGFNNRCLKRFSVDLNVSKALFSRLKQQSKLDYLCVAESGYSSREELASLEALGFSAVLIGEGLVTNRDMMSFFSS